MPRLLVAFCCWAALGAALPSVLGPPSSPSPSSVLAAAAGGGPPRPVAPRPGWLGLNGNSSTYLGAVDLFSQAGVVFDRNLELIAGSVPGEGGAGSPGAELPARLAIDHRLGMSPVAVIEYAGYDRPGYEFRPDPEFPHGSGSGADSIAAFVAGFIRSATAIRALAAASDPGTEVRFEVMNEPWTETTPQFEAGAYARVVAALLPAARAAGIPAADIYVAATGEDCSAAGCAANGWVEAMYEAEPSLRRVIGGWYLHPYGPAGEVSRYDNGGIRAVPLIRRAMASGGENVIVSEVGFCSREVNNPEGEPAGVGCDGSPALTEQAAAAELTATLRQGLVYHREGWLRALIVYSRNDGGWAMQLPGGALTSSGRALLSFAAAAGG